MEELKKPTTHLTEVLYHLINHKKASVKEFYWMSGFRTRISDLNLKYGLILNVEHEETISKHGNKGSIAIHKLNIEDIPKAKDIYNSLTGIVKGKPRVFKTSEILKIRAFKGYKTQDQIAKEYKCSKALISKIQNNKIYTHV